MSGMSHFAVPNSKKSEALLRTGEVLACVVCRGREFDRREIKLNTTGLSFMGLDWANKSADGAICRACGFVHSFVGELEWRTPEGEA